MQNYPRVQRGKPIVDRYVIWTGLALGAVIFCFGILLSSDRDSNGYYSGRAGTIGNLKQLGLAVFIYRQETKTTRFPRFGNAISIERLAQKFIHSRNPLNSNNPNGIEFTYTNQAADWPEKLSAQDLEELPLIYDSVPWPKFGERVVCFADGHVSVVSEQRWKNLRFVPK